MMNKVFYILLEDKVVLSKKEYADWREIQKEYFESYKANLGPWTFDELISYLEDDFVDEKNWPFKKDTIRDFFSSSDLVLYEE